MILDLTRREQVDMLVPGRRGRGRPRSAAKEKTDKLCKLLKEAGAVIYAQRPDAGVFRETKIPEGARVVDADYRESRKRASAASASASPCTTRAISA